MTKPKRPTTFFLALGAVALSGAMARAIAQAPAAAPAPSSTDPAAVARGAYLVSILGCHDCHTPFKLGPQGPEPDMSRALTGHPAELVMPPAPKLGDGPWAWSGAITNTAFAGPWGVSFAANLRPDPETGLGKWNEEMFVATIRSGRHLGKGRPVLPPMPVKAYRNMTDEDFHAVFSYLQSLPPVRNRVPAPIDPPEGQR